MKKSNKAFSDRGFSLLELCIAMTVTLILMAIASTLIAASFTVRNRENSRSAAIADAQRALNIMSREIANAGYGLSTNGIVTGGDSNATQIRVRSDLDLSGSTNAADEDVKYVLVNDANGSFIVRMNLRPAQTTGLIANRIDGLVIYYYDERVTYTIGDGVITNVLNSAGAIENQSTADNARYIVLLLRVALPAVGRQGSAGYQPASSTQLVSTVTLRNANLQNY
ncbi:MAG: prepilin-type N-terminal cleavage/methylation domain-containing protein [Pyrinomonadaceae bacterium]